MSTKSLFTKNYFLFIGVIVLCFSLLFVFTFLMRSVNLSKERDIPPHHETFSFLLRASGNPIETMKKYRESSQGENAMPLDLVDKEGKSLIDGQMALPRPLTPEEVTDLSQGLPVSFRPNLTGPPEAFITALKDADNYTENYLVAKFGPRKMIPGKRLPRGPFGGPPPFLFFSSLLSFSLCILISVGIALLIFLANYSRQAKAATAVLDRMKHGDLKARMTSRKFDELAPLTQAFNQMADEVESLVESLKRSDKARRSMLQDLAHDLRTPLASLRVFLETLSTSGNKMTEEKRQEVLQISLGEISYFSELVEDLLFLAQISEPKYSLETNNVDLGRVIQDQVILFQNQFPQLKVRFSGDLKAANKVPGSEQLIIRLVKNALANACSFARSEVQISLQQVPGKVEVVVSDDGPGFNPDNIAEFGTKKASRKLSRSAQGARISVGIGSVIMREIAVLHGGSLAAANKMNGEAVAGAKVQFSFKTDGT